MKGLLSILCTLLFLSQPLIAQYAGQPKLEDFNKFLGEERALVLQDAVDCFDQFLVNNYPYADNKTERIASFLEQIADHNEPDNSWLFDQDCNEKIIGSFESTGLRKEICLYEYESYESENEFSEVLPPPLPVDTMNIKDLGELNLDLIEEDIIPISNIDREKQVKIQEEQEERNERSLNSNGEGDYIFALLKFSPQESFVYEYAQAARDENRISAGVLANGFLFGTADYEDPFVRRLLVTEFYYWLITLERKK